MDKVKIFISYSHENTDLFREFKKGIESYSKISKNIEWDIWTDVQIPTGAFWHEIIQDEVKESKAAILLVSQYFFTSDYIKNKEFKKFVEKNKNDNFTFFPVLLSDCEYKQWEDLTKIQFFAPQGQDYEVEIFKNKIVPYDYISKDNLKNTYYKHCVEAFENAIKSKTSTKKKSLETSEIIKNEIQSSKSIEDKFQDFQKQIMEVVNKQNEEIESLKQTVDFLINEAYHGLQPISNSLRIKFDKSIKKYIFHFEKQFKIIADGVLPIRYQTQFYANKILNDGEAAKLYYEQNRIMWEDLNVGANISISNDKGKTFGDEIDVIVDPKTKWGNFIPFDICFEPKDEKTQLNLEKDNVICVQYFYSIPIEHWGSYINRHLSYFNESLTVVLEYDKGNNNLITTIKQLIGDKSKPTELSKDKYKIKNHSTATGIEQTIVFTGDRFEKYRITWDADKYFKQYGLNTVDSEDQLGLTNK